MGQPLVLSCTLHVPRCTEVSQPMSDSGQERRFLAARLMSIVPPIVTIKRPSAEVLAVRAADMELRFAMPITKNSNKSDRP